MKQLKAENKQRKVYSRVLTNQMTIVGWKLFKSDRTLHLAFMVYRLRRDFGFTAWEIANLTGIPTKQVYKLWEKLKPLLNSEILKILGDMDYKGELQAWDEIPFRPGKPQGLHVVRDYPAWYLQTKRYKRWSKKAILGLGNVSEKDWERTSNHGG